MITPLIQSLKTLSYPVSLQTLNAQIREFVTDVSLRRDIDWLLLDILAIDLTELKLCGDIQIGKERGEKIIDALSRLENGEPLAYILGQAMFLDLDLKVTKDVLIPRADTEVLALTAIDYLKSIEKPVVIDAGTGSGAIALSIAQQIPHALVYALDIDKKALKVAIDNAAHHKLDNVEFVQSDWLNNLPESVLASADMLVSNPPYIAENDLTIDQSVCDHEPHHALFAESDGLNAYEILLETFAMHAKQGAIIGFEHGEKQRDILRQKMIEAGFDVLKILDDMSRKPRCIWAKRNI